MPNGGSDCCGTCCFNSANGGRAGYADPPSQAPATCTIRGGLPIENAFWTYCANHPHHNPNRIQTPVGPVYHSDSYPYTRGVLQASPDTPEIRDSLLSLLDAIQQEPGPEYPSPTQLDDEVVRQLGVFKEKRAIPGLRRILAYDPDVTAPDGGEPARDRRRVIGIAVVALASILGDGALREVRFFVEFGLDRPDSRDRYAILRFFAASALQHLTRVAARPLLEIAARDPHPEVSGLARKRMSELDASP